MSETEEAFELIQQHGDDDNIQPDTVLLDWNLEEGTGNGVLKQFKENLPETSVPHGSIQNHGKTAGFTPA